MAAVPVFRQAETLTGFNITSQTDMLTALGLLLTVGYSGEVIGTVEGQVANYILQFGLINPTVAGAQGQQSVAVGGWVVYSSITLEAVAYTAAQFATVFHT